MDSMKSKKAKGKSEEIMARPQPPYLLPFTFSFCLFVLSILLIAFSLLGLRAHFVGFQM
jgi:hypothetical protein